MSVAWIVWMGCSQEPTTSTSTSDDPTFVDSSPSCDAVEGPSECQDVCDALPGLCGIHYNICEPLPWEDSPQVRCTEVCAECLRATGCFTYDGCGEACPCLIWVSYD